MEKTQDGHYRREQIFPGHPGGFPTVGIYGFRRIFGIQIPGFLLKITIGLGEFFCARTCRNTASENAFPGRSGGYKNLFTIASGMFFIGRNMFRQTISGFDGSSHDGVATQ
jgi:hypothetical protein